jgi:hypothetical protein
MLNVGFRAYIIAAWHTARVHVQSLLARHAQARRSITARLLGKAIPIRLCSGRLACDALSLHAPSVLLVRHIPIRQCSGILSSGTPSLHAPSALLVRHIPIRLCSGRLACDALSLHAPSVLLVRHIPIRLYSGRLTCGTPSPHSPSALRGKPSGASPVCQRAQAQRHKVQRRRAQHYGRARAGVEVKRQYQPAHARHYAYRHGY